jgi:glycosyltransferase involved in cell wall biosynthesis
VNVLVVVPYLADTAPSQRYRIEQWAALLNKDGVSLHVEPFESPQLKEVFHRPGHLFTKAWAVGRCIVSRMKWLAAFDRRRWDAVFLHRELLPIGPPVLEWLLARTGVPIVYDFDDAIFLPNISDANRGLAWLKWPDKTGTICRLSAHVTAGNEYLAQFAASFNPRVTVVATTIDCDKYTPKGSVVLHEPPVIGWTGSHTTIKYLQALAPTLQQLRKSCEFRLKVVGVERFAVPGIDVESVRWTSATEVADISDCDIGVMPLPDDEWSRGKCGLKVLTYMALGIPVVASPVGVNSVIVADGRNGFLAANEHEWVDKLTRLLTDAELRRRFAAEGRRMVEAHYSAKVQAPRLLEVLRRACNDRAHTVRRAVPLDAGPQSR